jgi:hypothetical protein
MKADSLADLLASFVDELHYYALNNKDDALQKITEDFMLALSNLRYGSDD